MSAFLIADDHEILRSGLTWMIKSSFPDAEVGQAADGAEALRLLTTRQWDVLVLDIGLPGRSGLDILPDVLHLRPNLPVLILTGLTDDAIAIQVFERGAMGYLCKDCSEEDLARALKKLMAGGRYLTTTLAEKLAARLRRPAQRPGGAPCHEISGRMLDVLVRLGQGDTVKSIAADMGVSIKTISTYRARLLQRLHLKSSVELVRYCLLHGLAQ